MLVGYARVSTSEQNLDAQTRILKEAGCEKIFVDKISGIKTDRPGLTAALAFIRPGDSLVVWRLDRLGRSLKDLIQWVNTIQDKGIEFKSLHEAIDTSTSVGKLTFHIFGALSEFERNIIRDRTMAGLEAARARGRQGGRPPSITDRQRKQALELYQQRTPVPHIIKIVGISKTTLYKLVNAGNKLPESL